MAKVISELVTSSLGLFFIVCITVHLPTLISSAISLSLHFFCNSTALVFITLNNWASPAYFVSLQLLLLLLQMIYECVEPSWNCKNPVFFYSSLICVDSQHFFIHTGAGLYSDRQILLKKILSKWYQSKI